MVGEYPVIEKIGLASQKKGAKMCLNFLKDLKNTNERHHYLATHRLLS
jgi:hypothetical protein